MVLVSSCHWRHDNHNSDLRTRRRAFHLWHRSAQRPCFLCFSSLWPRGKVGVFKQECVIILNNRLLFLGVALRESITLAICWFFLMWQIAVMMIDKFFRWYLLKPYWLCSGGVWWRGWLCVLFRRVSKRGDWGGIRGILVVLGGDFKGFETYS